MTFIAYNFMKDLKIHLPRMAPAVLLAGLLLSPPQGQAQTDPDPISRWPSDLLAKADEKAKQAALAVQIYQALAARGPQDQTHEFDNMSRNPTNWPDAYQDALRKQAEAVDLVREQRESLTWRRLEHGLSPLQSAKMRRFSSMILSTLREHKLPDSLLAVPLIESGFDPTAVSAKGATGLWQFMPATARRFGLYSESREDQRRDPIHSTRAAALYLKELYGRWQDWPLALAAYNAGEQRVQRALNATTTKTFEEIAARKLVPEETLAYVPAVMKVFRATTDEQFSRIKITDTDLAPSRRKDRTNGHSQTRTASTQKLTSQPITKERSK